jgi:hypothetical protein
VFARTDHPAVSGTAILGAFVASAGGFDKPGRAIVTAAVVIGASVLCTDEQD